MQMLQEKLLSEGQKEEDSCIQGTWARSVICAVCLHCRAKRFLPCPDSSCIQMPLIHNKLLS